jgi:hypothetical protein
MGIIYKDGIPYGNQPNGTVPSGGTTGQVLKKVSNTDYDTEWANESGGGGTSDYTQLSNKPQINGVTLTGNKSLSDIGAASQSDLEALEDITGDGQLSGFTATDLTGAENELKNTLNAVEDALAPLELTGTNTTGSTIKAGTFFRNNGVMVRATTDISANSAITSSNSTAASGDGALNTLLSFAKNAPVQYINNANNGAYSDSSLYTILKNSSDITPSEFKFFSVQFDGGKRFGMCYLYDNTKLYGVVVVFYYNGNPRIFTVSNGTITVRQFASS